MLAVLGVALVLAAVGWADRTRDTGLGEVAHCLSGSGAKVAPSAAAPWKALSDRGAYEVRLGRDRGTLLRVRPGVSGARLQAALDAEGARVAAQSSGRILVLWRGRPAASSAAALNRCLR